MKTHLHGPRDSGASLRERVRGRAGERAICRILFVHGTVGQHLLADPASDALGGGLRGLLEAEGHEVHQAFQGSELGALTDREDFPAKLGDSFERLCRTVHQEALSGGATNDVIVFKSCFRQNKLRPDAAPPRLGPTVLRARDALRTLRDQYAAHPHTHFVWMTTPPFEPRASEGFAKRQVRAAIGMDDGAMGQRAWELNRWTVVPEGWLGDYHVGNLSVFDYFTILTGGRRDGLLDYPSRERDRPSGTAQRLAAKHFVAALRSLLAGTGGADAGRSGGRPPQ